MTSKITLTVTAFLFALSGAAVARTANAPSHATAAQSSQAFDWAAPASGGETNAYRYHGGPKSND